MRAAPNHLHRSEASSQEARRVYRFDDGSAVHVGDAGPGVVLPQHNEPLDGPNDHALLACEERVECGLYRASLDPPSSERLAVTALPTGDRLSIVAQRELACSSVEAFVATIHEQVGAWPTLQYYLVRVAPSP